jgi:hypothetical protein
MKASLMKNDTSVKSTCTVWTDKEVSMQRMKVDDYGDLRRHMSHDKLRFQRYCSLGRLIPRSFSSDCFAVVLVVLQCPPER